MNATALVPSYNPEGKLLQVVQGLLGAGFSRVIVVDDGSSPGCEAQFQAIAALPGAVLLRHPQNRGKGCALKTGYRYFLEHPRGHIGVVSVDGDGQHLPADALACAEALERNLHCLVFGARDFWQKNVPLRSRLGNLITAAIFRMIGAGVRDTQTGLRAMGPEVIEKVIGLPGDRFEYETNVILAMAGLSIQPVEVPITTVYEEAGKHRSHFRTVQDSLRVYRQIFSFCASSFSSFLVDIAVFTAVSALLRGSMPLGVQLLWASVAARAVSLTVNYLINKRLVFRAGQNAFLKFMAVAVGKLALSYLLVYGLTSLFPPLETAFKIAVDFALFWVGFRLQRLWVFLSHKGAKNHS